MPRTSEHADRDATYQLRENEIVLAGPVTWLSAGRLASRLFDDLKGYEGGVLTVNLDGVDRLDSTGAVVLRTLEQDLDDRGTNVVFEGGAQQIRDTLESIDEVPPEPAPEEKDWNPLEHIGVGGYKFLSSVLGFVYLAADVFYYSVTDLFRSKTYRRDELTLQITAIGVSAVPIVGAMAFLIGAVLALQATAQLRQFGADRFVVDLTVVSMLREMGPLVTAIIVAGRSGSAIAAEIATMKVSDEFDALTTMALDPTRFLIVPKMYAALLTMPFLTILANTLGITGSMAVTAWYLDIGPETFLGRVRDVFYLRDVLTGIVKSVAFGAEIVLVGAFFGLRARFGAREVGQMTTRSVVVAISLVIVIDSILGLLFY